MKIKQKIDDNVKLTLNLYELTVLQTILCKVTLGSGEQSNVVKSFISAASAYIDDLELFPVGVSVELDPKYGIDFSINIDKETNE